MNRVEMLEAALEWSQQLGIPIRRDLLMGVRGGLARIGEQPTIFVDPSLPTSEQIHLILDGIRRTGASQESVPPTLRRFVSPESHVGGPLTQACEVGPHP